MSETIPGGLYLGRDGEFHDANGKPVELTAELRKKAKELGLELPAAKSKPKPKPAPKPEPEPAEEG